MPLEHGTLRLEDVSTASEGRRTPSQAVTRTGADRGAAEHALEARGLHKSYGEQPVLRDVSLTIARGEGMALLGPNGSGKTTLLGVLAGVLKPDAGSALCAGLCTTKKRARRGVGFVPQSPAVYDELSARENVALFARLHGLRGEVLQRSVERALDETGLSERSTARASTYSGGMRRRLSLACALVHQPQVLLLDEPFEGVDQESRAHLLQVLSECKRRQVALVMSTHRLEEVSALCERSTLLRAGAVVETRSTAELRARSQTET